MLPFSLMLFLAGSMSHADAATVQVGQSVSWGEGNIDRQDATCI